MDYYQQASPTAQNLLRKIGVPNDILNAPCMEIINQMEDYGGWNFNMLNIVKYVYRAGQKTADPAPDLLKAKSYIGMQLRRRYSDLSWLPERVFLWWSKRDRQICNLILVAGEIDRVIDSCRSAAPQCIAKHQDWGRN